MLYSTFTFGVLKGKGLRKGVARIGYFINIELGRDSKIGYYNFEKSEAANYKYDDPQ